MVHDFVSLLFFPLSDPEEDDDDDDDEEEDEESLSESLDEESESDSESDEDPDDDRFAGEAASFLLVPPSSICFSFFFRRMVRDGRCKCFLFPVHSYVQWPNCRHF